jgi:hypothetical protein
LVDVGNLPAVDVGSSSTLIGINEQRRPFLGRKRTAAARRRYLPRRQILKPDCDIVKCA